MILYSLHCECGHEFDRWFDNMADFDDQKSGNSLDCPSCGGHRVEKAIMAPRVAKPQPSAPAPCGAPSCGSGGACPMMEQF